MAIGVKLAPIVIGKLTYTRNAVFIVILLF